LGTNSQTRLLAKRASVFLSPILLVLFSRDAVGQDLRSPFAKPAEQTVEQQSDAKDEYSPYCDALAKGKEHSEGLAQVCRFALSLSEKMPNVICSLKTVRYRDRGFGGMRLLDTVSAEVAYENGQERHTNLAVNGNPIDADAPQLSGGWSTGEFAGVLRDIFVPDSQPDFRFMRTGKLRSRPADVFEFHIARKDNYLWFLQAGAYKVYPGYSGKLWIDETNSQLMRLEMGDIEIDRPFPLSYFQSVIEYSEVHLGDGTNFVLPVHSEAVACRDPNRKPCYRNLLTFENWHRFVGKAKILMDATP